jgi:hypothetical protein
MAMPSGTTSKKILVGPEILLNHGFIMIEQCMPEAGTWDLCQSRDSGAVAIAPFVKRRTKFEGVRRERP